MDSFIQKGVTLKGVLRARGVILVEGRVEGQVFATDHLIVGESGNVLGNIEAGHLTNRGSIQGDVVAGNKVVLVEKSHLTGDITAFQLVVEEGSNFDGRCKMLSKPTYQSKPHVPEPAAKEPVPPAKNGAAVQTMPSDKTSAEKVSRDQDKADASTGSGVGNFFRQLFSG
ncbi:bactofilin family protein [Nitrospina watsonii]|uniref:Polymer-forming cytoskeletal protein n=1 Tax=Nitrospina watsonii TaxID=1323948 RepID=A0ABN8VWK4_9BACT|nr:polymer-forming cytoskeletal protein [Nitrospina watsonii]CAI2718150.1 conserved protein of unknown function [Nitrospina watsonii]